MVKGLLDTLLDDVTLLGTTVGQPTTKTIMSTMAFEAIEQDTSRTQERRQRP